PESLVKRSTQIRFRHGLSIEDSKRPKALLDGRRVRPGAPRISESHHARPVRGALAIPRVLAGRVDLPDVELGVVPSGRDVALADRPVAKPEAEQVRVDRESRLGQLRRLCARHPEPAPRVGHLLGRTDTRWATLPGLLGEPQVTCARYN